MDYIVLAIPFFFLLIGIEWTLAVITRRRLYRLNDSVNDLSMGIIDQVGGAFLGAITFAGYLYLWQNWRLFDMGASSVWDVTGIPLWVWISCFVVKDFAYYWAHRLSHEMNIGWATHIAHHQSEEFNLSVALRQGVFQGFFFNIFYLPLALLGFPPAVYVTCSAFNTLYQFWIHTRLIGKLGPIEWIMNTPSHHRVHHGRDPKYIDRNHAGVFIIWDRLFGTFQEEEEEPNYGLVSPLQSWNPLWGQVHYLVRIAKVAWQAPRWSDKLRVFYKAPAWHPEGMAPQGMSAQEKWEAGIYRKYHVSIPRGLKNYVLLHFAPMLFLVTGFLQAEAAMTPAWRAISAALIFWALLNLGGILELRRWVRWSEPLRLCTMAGLLAVQGGAVFGWPQLAGIWFAAVQPAFALVSLAWLLPYWKRFTVRTPLPWQKSAEMAQTAAEA